ncbi:MAG: TadE/TadG family type IV pilus assembly protein [Pseudomonadota bacterium]
MVPLLKVLRVLRPFFKRDEGSSTVEFVIIFPVFMTVMLSSVEAGVLMLRHVMLERSLDLVVRTLRLGIDPPADEVELLEDVCENVMLIPDCANVLRVELTRVSTASWNVPTTGVTCVQRGEELQPLLNYTLGADHDIMLVRVCAVVDPFFPTTGLAMRLPLDDSGGYALVSSSAFVNEPS